MKQLYLRSILLCLFLGAMTVKCLSWTTEYIDGFYYQVWYSYNRASYAIITYEDYPDDDDTYRNYASKGNTISVPETLRFLAWVGGKADEYYIPVISVGDYAFHHCPATNIYLSNKIRTIKDYAFWGCQNMESFVVPSSVTEIGKGVFDENNLTEIVVNENNSVYDSRNNCNAIIETESNTLIYGCKGTTIPSDITAIGSGAFKKSNVLSVNIPNSVTSIGMSAFAGCSNLSSILIPSSVNIIEESTFLDCNSLTSVTLPNSITSIGNYAFGRCSSLTSIIIPDGVTSIGRSAFEGCSNLSSIYIPSSVKVIEDSAFSGCGNLTNITIPDGVTSIGEAAFQNCVGLTSITIPSSVSSIAESAFEGCSNLTEVSINSSALLSTGFYLSKVFGQASHCIIGDAVTSIGNYAFDSCVNLSTITIPQNLQIIGLNAFSGCSSLNKVIVKDLASWCNVDFGVTSYGTATSNPLSLAHHLYSDENTEIMNLVIPEGVNSIKATAFYGANNLESVRMPNSLTTIGSDAFEGCTSLNKVIVPDIKSWCNMEFKSGSYYWGPATSNPLYYAHHLYCNDETEIIDLVIPKGVEDVNSSAFCGCSSLKSVTVPGSVKYIGSYSFYGCDELEKVIVPDIASWCGISFSDNPLNYAHHLYSDANTEVTNLVIPATVTAIGDGAFYNASSITSVRIPNSVKIIGAWAFEGCSDLKSIVIPNGVTEIGCGAFCDCSTLESVVIPNSVRKIDEGAFQNCMSLYSVTSLINIPFKLDNSVFGYDGSDYNEDIIYMVATLYVPRGRTAVYSNVNGWKKFFNIVEIDTKYKLTYVLDGQEYKTYEIQAAEVITPEPDPVKEDYIFSGWSEIPYLMPAHDVTVTGSFILDPDGIRSIENEKLTNNEANYDLSGRKLDKPQKGVNIIRMSDGTTRKVLIK